jgi:hypothetical protein
MGAITTAVIAGTIAATGGGMAIAGESKRRRANREAEAQMDRLESTRYGDFTQDYYNTLANRARQGLPQEQLAAAQMGADRATSLALGAMGDRRSGVIGMGQAQSGLADAYRQIAMVDAQQRMQNEQQFIGEMGNRGQMAYQEEQGFANMRLADARTQRREGQQMTQAGIQTAVNGLGLAMNPMGSGAPKGAPPTQAPTMQAPQLNTQPLLSPSAFGSPNELNGFEQIRQRPSGWPQKIQGSDNLFNSSGIYIS